MAHSALASGGEFYAGYGFNSPMSHAQYSNSFGNGLNTLINGTPLSASVSLKVSTGCTVADFPATVGFFIRHGDMPSGHASWYVFNFPSGLTDAYSTTTFNFADAISSGVQTATVLPLATSQNNYDWSFAVEPNPSGLAIDNNHWAYTNTGGATMPTNWGNNSCQVRIDAFTVNQDAVIVPGAGATRFIDPYIPTNGSFASTSPTVFSYQYNFNDTTSFGIYDTVGVNITDLTNSLNNPTLATSTINASGISTYTTSVALTSGHSYLWRPIMFSSTGTSSPLYGNWYSFQSTSSPAYTPYTPYTPPGTTLSTTTNPIPIVPCGISDISGCFQNAISYLFYPTVDFTAAFISIPVQGKFPFVYIYQIQQVRNTILSASSTAATSVTVPLWKLPGQTATSSLVMISSSLIAAVPYAGTVKTIITAILWILMAEYIYYRVTHMHDTNTPS